MKNKLNGWQIVHFFIMARLFVAKIASDSLT